jgi:hypothetical protein
MRSAHGQPKNRPGHLSMSGDLEAFGKPFDPAADSCELDDTGMVVRLELGYLELGYRF